MEHLNKTSTELLIEETTARGKEERNLEIAKNLLDVLDNAMIS